MPSSNEESNLFNNYEEQSSNGLLHSNSISCHSSDNSDETWKVNFPSPSPSRTAKIDNTRKNGCPTTARKDIAFLSPSESSVPPPPSASTPQRGRKRIKYPSSNGGKLEFATGPQQHTVTKNESHITPIRIPTPRGRKPNRGVESIRDIKKRRGRKEEILFQYNPDLIDPVHVGIDEIDAYLNSTPIW